MLDSTMELISLAASNSLAVFCVCNLIIAFLLVNTSKPHFNQDKKPNVVPTMVNADNFKNDTIVSSDKAANSSVNGEDSIVSSDKAANSSVNGEDENPSSDNEEAEDSDELRKRVEEFIDKINSVWKAEKLKA